MNKIISIAISLSFFGASLQAQERDTLIDENVIIVNESVVNDEKLNFSPTFYEDGVVFISSYTDKKSKVYDGQISSQAMMIKLARRGTDGKLMPPVAFAEELITPYHEGPLCFDKVAEEVFFSRNNYENGKLVLKKHHGDGKERALQQIYSAQKAGNKWKDVKKLPFNVGEYAYKHPALSIDGKKLYFSSDKPGGQGGFDIWVSNYVAGEWSEPVNAGEAINSKGNEAFPFIHADGTLFYASDKSGGLGGLDIYYAKATGKKGFTEAKNIGQPFNSNSDDFGLILDLARKNGYFTSARTGGKGMDDIYGFHSDEKIPFSKEEAKQSKALLCVLDKKDNSPIDAATVKYVNIDNYNISEMGTDAHGSINKLTTEENVNILQLVTDQPAQVLTTGADCKTAFVVAEGSYLVNVTKEGYAPKQVILKTKKDKDLYQVLMEKLDGRIEIVGLITDDKAQPIPGATVTIIDDATGEKQVVTSDPGGQIAYAVEPKKCYTLEVTKQNYSTQSSKVCAEGLAANKSIPVKVNMKQTSSPFVEGQVIELANVYYNFNDATLRPDALNDINALLKVMTDYPEIEIELASHTDCRASDAYNQNLSQRRAESVVRYLKEHGVASSRMIARGYGESKLRNQCADGVTCTEEEHQRNRRTEVKILRGANNAQVSVVDNLPQYIDAKPGATASPSNTYAAVDGAGIPKEYNTKQKRINTTPTNASPATPISDEGISGSFWVVAGSYANAQNATEQQLKMMNLGYPETTIEYAADVNTNRVVVGKMGSMEAASARVKELRAKGEKGMFVLRK
jgi:outer membrane protein OmpA-like peptidoglycan-associated protein